MVSRRWAVRVLEVKAAISLTLCIPSTQVKKKVGGGKRYKAAIKAKVWCTQHGMLTHAGVHVCRDGVNVLHTGQESLEQQAFTSMVAA